MKFFFVTETKALITTKETTELVKGLRLLSELNTFSRTMAPFVFS